MEKYVKKGLAFISALAMISTDMCYAPTEVKQTDSIALAADTGSRIRVDINANDGRTNSYTSNANNWIVSGDTSTVTYNGVTFTLSNGGSDGSLRSASCKTLTKSDGSTPTLTMDGATIKDATSTGILKLEISGLSAGTHSLTTWHSYFDNVTGSTMTVSVNGTKTTGVKNVTRVTDDESASKTYTSFTVKSGQTVTVLISPENSSDFNSAVLNAFEIDGADPVNSINHASPADGDTHAEIEDGLSWKAGNGAKSHNVYVGTSYDAVDSATTSSKEYKGNQTGTTYALDDSYSSLNDYYWRVDEVTSSGTVKGAVYHFQTARLSFPTAEGYGRYARGGRGGRIVEVTNLNDSGEGSLRQALEVEKGARIVVFRVGGIIKLQSKIIIPSDGGDVYIAGQTAPGDGITLTQYSLGMLGANDVIIRDIRTRVGDVNGAACDGMGMSSSNYCIVDHCSISWATDEGFSSRSAKNITFQRNIIAESLHDSVHYNADDRTQTETHAFAASISGYTGSFHHNLLIDCTGRNWSLAGGVEQDAVTYGGQLDIRNNVVYNWKDRTTDGGVRRLNFVGNYYKAGASSDSTLHVVSIDGNELGTSDMQMMYVSGNKMLDYTGKVLLESTDDAWAKGRAITAGKNATLADVRSDTPFFESYVTTQTADEAYKSVIADVGANAQGSDYLDTRYINEVKNGTYTYTGSKQGLKGIIDSQEDVGGYPNDSNFKGGTAPTDTDGDGMPDEWETKHGLDANDASDGNKITLSADDYTNIEMYLNELAGDTVVYNGTGEEAAEETTEPEKEITAATLEEGGVYMIKNVNSGLYMEVESAKTAEGTNIQQWGATSAASHNMWRVVASSKAGYYYLYSTLGDGASYCLNLAGTDGTSETNIELANANYKDAEQFMFVENDDGSYTIRPRLSSGKSCVEVKDALTTSGANVQQWEANGATCQNWILEQVTDPGVKMDTSVDYTFQNLTSSLYMSADSTGNAVQLDSDSSIWSLESAGDNYYKIILDGKYLTVTGGNAAAGTNITVADKSDSDSQLFKFIKNANGTYTVVTKSSSDKCAVEVKNNSSTSGETVQQYTKNGVNCQKWTLTVVAKKDLTGDINADGSVDSKDLIMIHKYILKLDTFTQTEYTSADLNGDSKVNAIDLAVLKGKIK